MTRLGSPLRDLRSACLVAGLLAALVYLNSLSNGFAYDDLHIVENNEAIQALATLPGALVEPYWPTAHGRELGLWRPVTTAALGIQYVVGGGGPLLFHVVNVGLHVTATVLSVVLLSHLMPLAAAFAGGLVFAVHPVHVEAVANVVGFSELFSTVAILLACLVHLRAGRVTGWGSALAIGVLYLLGFGAKESGVTLPGLLFVLDAARGRLAAGDVPRYLADRWREYLVLLLVAVGVLLARFGVLGSIASPFAPVGADILHEIPRIYTLGEIWLHYVRLWVFPLDLSADYSPNVIPVSSSWRLDNAVGVALALAILTAAFAAWRRPAMEQGRNTARAAAFGVVWFLVAISPTSNTVFLSGVLLAERTFYLPSVGLAAATGWLVVRLARDRPRGAWVLLVIAVVASGVRTWTRNPTWHDTSRVFTQLVRDYPHSGRSQWILGDQFMMAGRPSEGLRAYRAAISLLDTSYPLITEIARSLIDHEYYQGGERLLDFALADNPEFITAYRLYSASRAEQGDPVGTEEWARAALAVQPPGTDPARHHLLAWALAAQGRMEEAAEERARGEEVGRAVFWQGHVYDAYVARDRGDASGVQAALERAREAVRTRAGAEALDSAIVSDFGSRLPVESRDSAAVPGPGR